MRFFVTVSILFFVSTSWAQVNNIVSSSPPQITNGPPTYIPGPRGSVVAIDSLTGIWWVNPNRLRADTWFEMGHTMRKIGGCSAPSGAPTKFQSWLVTNNCTTPQEYLWDGAAWDCLNCGSSGAVATDATIDGDGTGGDPLGIAQQGATTSKILMWTGATWEPSWGTPYTYVTSGASITTAVNEILIGTLVANVVMGLPTCDAATDGKHFKFIRNGTDSFSVTFDPAGSQAFGDGTLTKTSFGTISIDCTCKFSAGTGIWFYDNF